MADPRETEGARPVAVNHGPVVQQVNVHDGQHTFNVHTSAVPSPTPRRANLPPRCVDFVGRGTELAEIHTLIVGGVQVALAQRAAKPGGLTGLGGVGKTTLACEYAHLHLDDYEHICWVNAAGSDPSAAFAALADDPLRLGLQAGATVPDRVVAVKQHLERASGRVLIIFDNVDHPKSWRALVPTSPHVRVLVTTRREDLLGVQKVRVEVLPDDQALDLLLGNIAISSAERDAGRDLCRELGCLTLAVALASRLLARPGAVPSALLKRVRAHGAVQWSELSRGEELLEKNPSLVRLFDASLELLDKDDPVDAYARHLLVVGSCFDPGPIDLNLLFLAATRSSAPTAEGPDVQRLALERLFDMGLVRLDDRGRPLFHRLVAAYAAHGSRHRSAEPTTAVFQPRTTVREVVLEAVAAEGTGNIFHRPTSSRKGPVIPTLRVVAGRDMLKYATLAHEGQIILGRDESAELRLTDVTVSKRHARVITDHSGTIMVEDLQSTNGTSVNCKPITRTLLRPGDHLEVAGVSLRLDLLTLDELGHLGRVVQRLDASNRDPVTRLLTRAFLDEDLPQLMERCSRGNLPLSCAFIDVDRLKDVNDRFGNQVGDEVLVTIGRLLMLSVRDNDPAVRYGGEELLLFLPGSDERGAVDVTERIRRAVGSHDWDCTAPGLRVTVSIGVAERHPDEDSRRWLERADLAMCVAKQAGRNRVQWSSALGRRE